MLRTDGFLLELDAAGRNLIFATLIGGAYDEDVYGLALTGDTVTIAGRTRSPDFPASDHSLPSCNLASFSYPSAIFLASFNRSGKLVTSVQYGACVQEVVTGLVAASSGVWLTAWYADQKRTFAASIDLASTTPVGISAVVNAASFEMGTCTPLEIITVIGSGLGPKQGVAAPAANLPVSLGGTQLFFNGQPAPLLFVQEHQINAIVPSSVARAGVISIWAASTAGRASSAVLLTATEIFTPGLFTLDGSGIGQGAILNQDGSINSASNAASRGSIVSLFWTGGGVTNPLYADGQVISTTVPLLYGAAAIIGDQFAYRDDVLYAGVAPGLVNGTLQLNNRIPQNAQTGPAVPIAVFSSLGSDINIPSQPGVTISVK